MHAIDHHECLTCVVVSDDTLQLAGMSMIQARIREAVDQLIPPEHQAYICNALLALALEVRMDEHHAMQRSGE